MTSNNKPVSLIIGAGSRLGLPLVERYIAKNYTVITASRNPVDLRAFEDAPMA